MANSLSFETDLARNMIASLETELVLSQLCTTKYTEGISDRNNLTLRLGRRPRFVSVDNHLQFLPQDVLTGYEEVSLDRTAQVSFQWEELEKLRRVPKMTEDATYQAAVTRLATTIDRHVGEALLLTHRLEGNPVNTLSDPVQIMRMQARLQTEGATHNNNMLMGKMGLHAAISHFDNVGLSAYVKNTYLSGRDMALEKMSVSTIAGTMLQQSAILPTITTGSRVDTATVAAPGGNVNAEDIIERQLLNQDLNLSNLGPNATISRGEKFTIDGVRAYNCAGQVDLDYLQDFTVMQDVTADGAGNATVRITPSLVVFTPEPNLGDAGVATVLANNAYATVVSAPAANAAVNFRVPRNTTYRVRAGLTRNAISLVWKTPVNPKNAPDSRVVRAKASGCSLRVWPDSQQQNSTHPTRIDVFYGVQMVNPEHTCQFGGPA